jgi:glucose-1-phosphate thymidylyltransferase
VARYAGRDLGDTRIDGRVVIHRSARVEGSVVRGPSIIGPGAQVIDSYVGPYSSIGPGSLIEGAEVEDLIIGEQAVVAKLGRRLAASVVGPGARVSRDFGPSGGLRVSLGARAQIVLS